MADFGWSYPPGCNGVPDDDTDREIEAYYTETIRELAETYCCTDRPKDQWERLIKKGVYKFTDCGAWIEFDESGVTLGSIVEGSDEGANPATISYEDFSMEWFWSELTRIENECDLIWEWANTVRDNGKTDAESGLDWPLPLTGTGDTNDDPLES